MRQSRALWILVLLVLPMRSATSQQALLPMPTWALERHRPSFESDDEDDWIPSGASSVYLQCNQRFLGWNPFGVEVQAASWRFRTKSSSGVLAVWDLRQPAPSGRGFVAIGGLETGFTDLVSCRVVNHAAGISADAALVFVGRVPGRDFVVGVLPLDASAPYPDASALVVLDATPLNDETWMSAGFSGDQLFVLSAPRVGVSKVVRFLRGADSRYGVRDAAFAPSIPRTLRSSWCAVLDPHPEDGPHALARIEFNPGFGGMLVRDPAVVSNDMALVRYFGRDTPPSAPRLVGGLTQGSRVVTLLGPAGTKVVVEERLPGVATWDKITPTVMISESGVPHVQRLDRALNSGSLVRLTDAAGQSTHETETSSSRYDILACAPLKAGRAALGSELTLTIANGASISSLRIQPLAVTGRSGPATSVPFTLVDPSTLRFQLPSTSTTPAFLVTASGPNGADFWTVRLALN